MVSVPTSPSAPATRRRRHGRASLGLAMLAAAAASSASAFAAVGGPFRRRGAAASSDRPTCGATPPGGGGAAAASTAHRRHRASPLLVSVAVSDADAASSPPTAEGADRRHDSGGGGGEEVREEQPHGQDGDDPSLAKPHPPQKRRTPRQISQLRYVMIRDVESMLRSSSASERRAAPLRAQENIDRMAKLMEETGDGAYRPDAALYNSLVRAHAKSGARDAARRAERVLESMREDPDLAPDATTYTSVVDALARSDARDAPVRAERILFRMMDEAEEAARLEKAGLGPAVEGGVGAATAVVLPTAVTCDAVLNAWARRGSREGAERAEKILARMEQLRDGGAEGSGASIRPTAYSYATVISAWAHSGSGAAAAEKAEALLDKMLAEAEKSGDADGAGDAVVRPNAVAFNAVIDAWSRSGNPRAGTKAEELLDRMIDLHDKGEGGDGDNDDLRPDVITYNTVMNAWSGTGDPDEAQRAEAVFRRLEADPYARPNARSYNSLLKAWSKSRLPGSAVRVDEILRSMIDEAAQPKGEEEDVDVPVRPDVISFSTALDAWAKSTEAGKARRARSILDAMVEFHMTSADPSAADASRPNAVCYNAVLNACAFSASAPDPDERKEALSLAVRTFNDCRSDGYAQPDSVTYGTMLKCVANLVPPGKMRDKMAGRLFGRCREEGLVNRMVLNEVRRAAGAEAASELLGPMKQQRHGRVHHHADLSDLPSEWTRNVKEKSRTRRHASAGGGGGGGGGGGRRGRKRGAGGGGGGRKGARSGKVGKEAAEEDKPILPIMRGLSETSWQSGKDV